MNTSTLTTVSMVIILCVVTIHFLADFIKFEHEIVLKSFRSVDNLSRGTAKDHDPN